MNPREARFPGFDLVSAHPKRESLTDMDQLFTPAHLHLAINHAPIIGLAVACIPLLIGIIFRSRGALASGLVCALLCVATVPAIMETGEDARESFAEGSLGPDIDAAGNSALREHSRHARTTAPVAYAAGLLALVSLIGLGKFPRHAAWLAWAVLVGNAATIALAVWTAEAGGRIRHPEFRPHGQQAPDFSKTSSSTIPAVFMPRTEEHPAPQTVAPTPSASSRSKPQVQPVLEATEAAAPDAASTPDASEATSPATPAESPAATNGL